MLYPPGFSYVKKPKRFVILSSDKSSERNLSCFFDIKKPRGIEHLQREEPFFSDLYFNASIENKLFFKYELVKIWMDNRNRPRFFDQVGHQTTNASIGNKHFFTK